jgi:hypothetical protein
MGEHQSARGGWDGGDWWVASARRLGARYGLQLWLSVGFVVVMWMPLECRMLVA